MQVAIDISFANHTKTGTYHYSKQIISELSKMEDVDLVVFEGIKLYKSNKKIIKIINALLELYYLHVQLPFLCWLKKIDVLHMPANIVPIWSPCPTVVTLHDLSVIRFPEKFDKLYALYAKLFFWISTKRSASIITISEASKNEILEYYEKIPKSKIHVVYNGVNNFILENRNNETQNKINSKYLLYVGAIEPWKNIPILINAYHLLINNNETYNNLKLVLIGSKGGDYKNVMDTIKRLNLENNVIYRGYVPDDELNEIYSNAEMLILPSVNEGFGLPVVEAMSHGVPVIVSNNGALPEIVGDSGIIVNNINPISLKEEIERVISDNDLKEELKKKGKKRSQIFSWRKTAEYIKEVYESLL